MTEQAQVTWTARQHQSAPRVTTTGTINTLPVDKKDGEESDKRRQPIGFAPSRDES